jgi:hypothetical protein
MGPAGRSEKPYPGSEVTTTSKASPACPAVGARVGEQRQQLEVLDERAREAMGEHDRQRAGPSPRAWMKWTCCPSIWAR